MTAFAIIPKMLPVREPMNYEQKIPKIIWQTMKTNVVPISIKKYSDTWIGLNPEYEYRLCDDDDIIEFIKNDFPDYLEGYKKIKQGASKADLWRYLVIYKYGGVYADIDCICNNSLRTWIDPKAAYVTQLGINKDICQWLIISLPQNPIFLKAAQKTLRNIENDSHYAAYYGFEFTNKKLSVIVNSPVLKFNHHVLAKSGPPVLQEAAEECFKSKSFSNILQFTQVICVSGRVSCQMNGFVTHDSGNAAYKKALRELRTHYYDSFLTRVIKKIITFFSGKGV